MQRATIHDHSEHVKATLKLFSDGWDEGRTLPVGLSLLLSLNALLPVVVHMHGVLGLARASTTGGNSGSGVHQSRSVK